MNLFIDCYNTFCDIKWNAKLINDCCIFDCSVNDIGVYGIFNDKNELIYIGRTNINIGNRINSHLLELYEYWYRRNKKSSPSFKKYNYPKLVELTKSLLSNNKLLIKRLSDNPNDEGSLIKEHSPYCNNMHNLISNKELQNRKKIAILEMRKIRSKYNL